MPLDLVQHRKEAHNIGHLQDYLKQIVYGGNDGIITTFAVVAGFAGFGVDGAAQVGGVAVLLFGIANILADGTSMGLGEFLSSRSERDLYIAHRSQELIEMAERPEVERAEVITILKSHGVAPDDAAAMTTILERNPHLMADFMMVYELGMADTTGESPALKGLFMFMAFVLFGAVPLSPYFFLEPSTNTFTISITATFGALVGLGLLRWHVTGVALMRCVFETVLVGGTCAVVAFAVGRLLAV
ncbi:MAG: VIT1/CCC1 transporter family protein [Rhodobacteraceae bacterium]|nr:VIT1/CCC1 transporter family protein [Paracoccaceae bacterium]